MGSDGPQGGTDGPHVGFPLLPEPRTRIAKKVCTFTKTSTVVAAGGTPPPPPGSYAGPVVRCSWRRPCPPPPPPPTATVEWIYRTLNPVNGHQYGQVFPNTFGYLDL